MQSKFKNTAKLAIIVLLVLCMSACSIGTAKGEIQEPVNTNQVEEVDSEEIEESTDVENEESKKSSRFSEEYIGKANPFEDVSEDKYYYTPVMWAVVNSITTGTSETTFSPNDNCSYGNTLMLLWNTMGKPEVGETLSEKFSELSGKYYYKAILWAYYRGILDDIDTSDGWSDKICTRADALHMIYKMSNGVSFDTGTLFTDVPEDIYYCEAVTWAVNHKIASGISETEFEPLGTCTRAHIVTYLYNVYNYGLIE